LVRIHAGEPNKLSLSTRTPLLPDESAATKKRDSTFLHQDSATFPSRRAARNLVESCHFLATALSVAAYTLPARGANIYVTTVEQKITSSNGCSLEEAIYSSNFGAAIAVTGYTGSSAVTIPILQCTQGSGANTIILCS
jgi:hypothetical protein